MSWRCCGSFAIRRMGSSTSSCILPTTPPSATSPPPTDQPVPIAGPHCWVKLIFGCGHVRASISSDGKHWANVHSRQTEGDITGIGVDLVAKRKDVRMTLRRVVLRELTGLTAPFPPSARPRPGSA